MAAPKGGYFKTAFKDVRGSKGWFPRCILLALLQIIPIFGQIVANGFFLGWARELAWNIKAPMPSRIFENRDGKLYRQGWFALVIYVVFFIIVGILICVGTALIMTKSSTTSSAYYMRRNGFSVTPTLVAGIIVLVITIIPLIAATLYTWVGQLRMSVYDRFGAGFQMGKLTNMIRADFGGIMRIFLMYIIMMIIASAIVGGIFSILLSVNSSFITVTYALIITGLSSINTSLARAVFIFMAVVIALCFILYVFTSFANLIVYRALGYWLSQFDVSAWPSVNEDVAFRKINPKKPKKGNLGSKKKAGTQLKDSAQAKDSAQVKTQDFSQENKTEEENSKKSSVVIAGEELAKIKRARVSKAQQVAMVQEREFDVGVPVQPSDPKTGTIKSPSVKVDVMEQIYDESGKVVPQEKAGN